MIGVATSRLTSRSRWPGLLLLCFLLGLSTLFAGIRPVSAQQAPPKHPLTGRQIASIFTDTAWLDRPRREVEEQPDRALELIGIKPGMVIADVGAGSGYMTVRLSARVGPTGKVYANDVYDVQTGMLKILQDKVRNLPILPDHKMSVADVRTEVEPEGFIFDRLVSQLPMQHIIVFRKPAQ